MSVASKWSFGLVVAALGAALGAAVSLARADSGPDVGSPPKAFKTFAATGEFAEKEVDFTAERKEKDTLYLFVNSSEWTRPTARYLKTVDTEVDKGITGAKELSVVVVWLTDDVGQAKEYMPKAQQSLKFSKTSLAVFDGPKQGPDGWNIDIAAAITAVVVREGKVAAKFNYQLINETDAPEVIKALTKS